MGGVADNFPHAGRYFLPITMTDAGSASRYCSTCNRCLLYHVKSCCGLSPSTLTSLSQSRVSPVMHALVQARVVALSASQLRKYRKRALRLHILVATPSCEKFPEST
jgi:hypothetical protein